MINRLRDYRANMAKQFGPVAATVLIVGGILFIAIIVFLIIFWIIRKRRQAKFEARRRYTPSRLEQGVVPPPSPPIPEGMEDQSKFRKWPLSPTVLKSATASSENISPPSAVPPPSVPSPSPQEELSEESQCEMDGPPIITHEEDYVDKESASPKVSDQGGVFYRESDAVGPKPLIRELPPIPTTPSDQEAIPSPATPTEEEIGMTDADNTGSGWGRNPK